MPSKFKTLMKRLFSVSESEEKGNDVLVVREYPSLNPRVLKPGRSPGLNTTAYHMGHKSRGKVYIFNHITFKKSDKRDGAQLDVQNLKTALPKLGFKQNDIEVFQDLKVEEIEEKLEIISKEDHSNNDLLVIFILTHGDKDGKIHAFDRTYSVHEVWEHFTADKCTTLIGKPKIFFIIACRGEKVDDGVVIKESLRKPSITEIDAVKCQKSVSYTIPIWADFLTVYSTAEGYYSFRNPLDGTWYIQALCYEIENYKEKYMYFLEFLTSVTRKVAQTFQTYCENQELSNKKQCPFFTSSLTKELYFDVKQDETNVDEEKIKKQRPKSWHP